MKTNENKENKRATSQSLSLFMTQPPKGKPKSPLRDRYNLANSIQASPAHQWNSKSKMILSQNSNSNFLTNLERSHFSASIKDKFRVMHISEVHELINNAREKKSEIEDLLRQEESKAEYDDLDEVDLSAGLRKLKKVVRLLEIVCKIILGKNDQNSEIDVHSQLETSFKGMHAQSVENYERLIQTKNCEISRLKKLVEILSCPPDEQTVSDNSDSQLIRSSFIDNLAYEVETQTEKISLEEEILDKSKELVQSMKLIKSNKFSICEEFSLWNICDAFKKEENQIQNTVEQNSHEKSLRVLSICRLPLVSVEEKSTFLKRYKSIVKICLNSLNICNNFLIKEKGTQEQKIVEEKIAEVSNLFNSEYHRNPSKYNDHFCKEIRDKIEEIYDELYSLYKNSIKSIEIETCSL